MLPISFPKRRPYEGCDAGMAGYAPRLGDWEEVIFEAEAGAFARPHRRA